MHRPARRTPTWAVGGFGSRGDIDAEQTTADFSSLCASGQRYPGGRSQRSSIAWERCRARNKQNPGIFKDFPCNRGNPMGVADVIIGGPVDRKTVQVPITTALAPRHVLKARHPLEAHDAGGRRWRQSRAQLFKPREGATSIMHVAYSPVPDNLEHRTLGSSKCQKPLERAKNMRDLQSRRLLLHSIFGR